MRSYDYGVPSPHQESADFVLTLMPLDEFYRVAQSGDATLHDAPVTPRRAHLPLTSADV